MPLDQHGCNFRQAQSRKTVRCYATTASADELIIDERAILDAYLPYLH
ncbi:hypothetical protein AB0K18_10470 [Nonomuraea sp. NPDC049421]